MSLATVGLAKGLGEGLIAMGGEVQTVFSQDTANKVEAIKQNRLETVAARQQNIENLYRRDESKTQKAQFEAGQTLSRDQMAQQDEQFKLEQAERERSNKAQEEANRIQEERLQIESVARIEAEKARLKLDERSLEHRMEIDIAGLSIEERKLVQQISMDEFQKHIQQGNLDLANKELEFMKEKFGYSKDLDALKLDLEKQALKIQERTADANIAARQTELALAEKRLEYDQADDATKNEIARETLEFQKLKASEELEYRKMSDAEQIAFLKEKFNLTHELAKEKQSFLEKSEADQIAFMREKFEQQKLTDADRKALEERRVTIQEELAELEGLKVDIDQQRADQQKTYQDAVIGIQQSEVDLKERGVVVQEGKLKLEQEAAKKEDWKITSITVTETVEDKFGNLTEVSRQQLVAINVANPDLQEVRILQDDGSWKWGSPGGAVEKYEKAINTIDLFMKPSKKHPEGLSYQEALAKAKELDPKQAWDVIEKLFLLGPTLKGEVTTPKHTDTVDQNTEPVVQSTTTDQSTEAVTTGRRGRASAGLDRSLITPDANAGTIQKAVDAAKLEPGSETMPDISDHTVLQDLINEYMNNNPDVSRHQAYQIIKAQYSQGQ